MEPEGWLPSSQEPSTGPYPEPDQSNSYRRWEDNITELKEKACEQDLSVSGYYPVAYSCQHGNQFWTPQNTGKTF
jgi:hypothetical protein